MANVLDLFSGSALLESHATDSGASWVRLNAGSTVMVASGTAYATFDALAGSYYQIAGYSPPSASLWRVKIQVGGSITGSPEFNLLLRCSVGSGPALTSFYILRYAPGVGVVAYRINPGNTLTTMGSAVSVTLVDGQVLSIADDGASSPTFTFATGGSTIATFQDTSGGQLAAGGIAGLNLHNPGGTAASGVGLHALWGGAPSGPTVTCTPGSTSLTVGGATTTATAAGFSGGQSFASSNTAVATVNPSTGVVTPVGAGTCTVVATGSVFPAETATSATITVATSGAVTGVTVTPSTATVDGAGTQTFSAAVAGTGTFSQGVAWTATLGTIGATTGAWTAPASTASAQTATITATSTQDGTKSGTATATIPASTVSSVSVSPSSATVAGGAVQSFSASVTGTHNPSAAVTWAASLGSINSGTGVFTAPPATSSVQTATVTATSVRDGTKSGTATVTIPVASADASYVCTVSNVPAGVTPTFAVNDLAGAPVTPSSGGTPVLQSSGNGQAIWTAAFSAPSGLRVGIFDVGGTKVVSIPTPAPPTLGDIVAAMGSTIVGGFKVGGRVVSLGYVAQAVDATHITLDATDPQFGVDNAGETIRLVSGTGKGQTGIVTASTTSTGRQTLVAPGWSDGVTPALPLAYQFSEGGGGAVDATTVIDGVVAALPGATVGGVANITGLSLSMGVVSASPTPTATAFTATGNTLNTLAGGYSTAPMSVFWQSGPLKGLKYKVVGHTPAGSNPVRHAMTVEPMEIAPVAGDTFVIG